MAKRNSALIWGGGGLIVILFLFVMVFGMRREGFLASGDECTIGGTCNDCPDGYERKTLNSGMESGKCKSMCNAKYSDDHNAWESCIDSCYTNKAGKSVIVCI